MGARQGHPNWMIQYRWWETRRTSDFLNVLPLAWTSVPRPLFYDSTHHHLPSETSLPPTILMNNSYILEHTRLLLIRKKNCQAGRSNLPLSSRPQSWWTISTYWNILACFWSEKKTNCQARRSNLSSAHNPDEQFLHIGTTYYLAFDQKKKQIVTLEDQIFPSPPTPNPDEQFLHIGTKLVTLDLQRDSFVCGKAHIWRCFTLLIPSIHSVNLNTITSVDKDQIAHFFKIKMMIRFLSNVESILTIFKEMFLETSSNYSHMTTAALPVFRSNIFFLE